MKSQDEAISWMKRAPFPEGTQLEIRQVFEDDDFAPSDPTGELRKKDAKRRQEYGRKARLAFLAVISQDVVHVK